MNNDHISKLDDYLKTFDSKTEDFFDYLPVAPEKEKNVVPHDNISYSSTYLVTI